MRKKKTINRAYLTDVNIDEVIDKHIERVTSASTHVEWDDSANNFIVIVDKEGNKAPRKAILYHKYLFLFHSIIMRSRASKNNSVQLNYARYVGVLGKVYGDMLYTLDGLGIITLSTTYTMGQSSRHIYLNDWNIGFIEDTNIKVIEYADKLRQSYQESIKEYSLKTDNSTFIKHYNSCLSKLELVDKTEALEYINSRKPSFKTEHSYVYYRSRIEDFNNEDLSVSSIDTNGRIYHYLTNLPKSLKGFFNIKFQADIANSHPLLFSYFLIQEYNINRDIIHFFSLFNYNNITEYHNKGKQLRKLLKHNGIEVQDSRTLPNDVLLFVYVTMKGRFWDEFIEVFKTMNRGEVKGTLFKEVFYSHCVTTRHKDYAKKFAEIYPNVWHSIRMMKKASKGNLPNKMMSFESVLFGKILRRCYANNWCVVSIHDAIIVLDTADNEQLDIESVKSVMLEEYAKYGLYPTISVDTYK